MNYSNFDIFFLIEIKINSISDSKQKSLLETIFLGHTKAYASGTL